MLSTGQIEPKFSDEKFYGKYFENWKLFDPNVRFSFRFALLFAWDRMRAIWVSNLDVN